MEASTVYAIATLGAIVAGPVIAVLLTRAIDLRTERKRRKYEVFRSLMQTRGIRLDPTHVAALNVVEIEFYDSQNIRKAFKTYIAHLNAPMPPVEEQDRFFDQRSDLFLELLSEIGKALGFSFDKRDLEKLSYVPQGWNSDENLRRKNLVYLTQVLGGERAIPVTNIISTSSPFPEPPEN